MREKEQEREKKKKKEREMEDQGIRSTVYKFSEHNERWSGLLIINRLFTPSHLLNYACVKTHDYNQSNKPNFIS